MNKEISISIVFVFTLLAISCNTNTISFKNLNFDTPCQSLDSACYWQTSYEVRSIFSFVERQENNNDFVFQMAVDNGVGYKEQAFIIPESDEELIFKFSAKIKTENLVGKGAGLTIGIYDKENVMIQSVDMGYSDFNYVKSTTDWISKKIETVIPRNANTIKIGLITYGTGIAYFDNAEVEFIQISDSKPSRLTRKYVDQAADSILKNSLLKGNIDIEPIREKAYRIGGDAKKPSDIYLAIRYMLQATNDKHAFFMPVEIREKWESTDEEEDDKTPHDIKFSTIETKDQFGYINVPGFHSNDKNLKLAFADTIRKQIKKLKNKNSKGWIVDLRNNDGGNMYPMLAGLEPLFSSDTLGFLIDVNEKKEYWGRGTTFENRSPDTYIKPAIHVKKNTNLPIAVLYGNRTGSSGEIVIISFVGNDNTKSFGQNSYGLTTGNGEFMLPDGSYMFFSSTYMADRNGKIYKSQIIPDELIEENDVNFDKTLDKAVNWLKTFLP